MLCVGIAAIIATTVFRGTGNAYPDKFSNQPAQLNHLQQRAPMTKAEYQLARRFIQTAVARK